ncbi:hypothetical protein ABH935_001503 [Catenulispora sp. GAS73]
MEAQEDRADSVRPGLLGARSGSCDGGDPEHAAASSSVLGDMCFGCRFYRRPCLMCGCGCGCGWLGCGGCGLLVDFRSFLRLRTSLRRIRWVAQFGGVPGVALAAGGVRVHDRARVRVTAHAFGLAGGGRVWWVPRVKDRASGGACAASGTRSGEGGSRCLPADAACGRLCPGFPVTSSPHGSRPASRYQAGSLLLWCCRVRLDTGCPVSVATPADATGNPGQPRLRERFPHLRLDGSPPPVATQWTPSTPQAGLSRIPQSLECPRRRRLLLTSGAHQTRPPPAYLTRAQ